jgi:hypothetical protein
MVSEKHAYERHAYEMAVYERHAYGDSLLEMHVYKSYHSRKRLKAFRKAGLSYRISSGCNV